MEKKERITEEELEQICGGTKVQMGMTCCPYCKKSQMVNMYANSYICGKCGKTVVLAG